MKWICFNNDNSIIIMHSRYVCIRVSTRPTSSLSHINQVRIWYIRNIYHQSGITSIPLLGWLFAANEWMMGYSLLFSSLLFSSLPFSSLLSSSLLFSSLLFSSLLFSSLLFSPLLFFSLLSCLLFSSSLSCLLFLVFSSLFSRLDSSLFFSSLIRKERVSLQPCCSFSYLLWCCCQLFTWYMIQNVRVLTTSTYSQHFVL